MAVYLCTKCQVSFDEGGHCKCDEVKEDAVNSPKHYQVIDDVEAIQLIARGLTQEQLKGYCLGNLMKYRLRAGDKGDALEDIAKARKYIDLYEQYRGYCHGGEL